MLPSLREELRRTADQKTLDRIEHARTCQNWSIIENTCYCGIGTPKVQPDISTPKARKEYVKYWKASQKPILLRNAFCSGPCGAKIKLKVGETKPCECGGKYE